MVRSFDGIALRQLRTRRLRALLTAFGIVLGVAMVFGVLLLVGTVRATFDELISAAWGSRDLIAMPANGGLLPQDAAAKVQRTAGVKQASAMVGGVAVRLGRDGRALTGMADRIYVAGYDPSQPPPYDLLIAAGRGPRSGAELVLERTWAQDHGLRVGDRIAVGTPSGPRRLPVVGLFRLRGDRTFGGQGLAMMPLDGARPVFDIPTGWLQISISAVDRGDAGPLRARLERALGPGVKVQPPQGYGSDIASQLQALNVVLYFFSGVALFVGGFLILNAFNMTVLQRTRELGMLRTLGATRAMVVRSVLVEALALGVIGAVFGLLLGLALAEGLIVLMRGLGLPVGALHISPAAAAAAVALGLATTAAGAWWPARRAGRMAPIRAVLQAGAPSRRPRPLRALVGAALFVPGVWVGGTLWFGGNHSSSLAGLLAIAVTGLMFLGMVLAAPLLITPLVRVFAAPLRRLAPTGGRLASDAVRANPARTAATAVALTIGLSVVVVNAAMSQSFLDTIHRQIDEGYARDVTVQPAGSRIEDGGAQTIAPAVRRQVAALPAAGVVTPLRVVLGNLPKLHGAAATGLVEGVDPAGYAQVDRTPIAGASRAAAFAGMARGGVVVGRGYAQAAHVRVGDVVTLRGARAARAVPVVGVFESMTTFSGDVLFVSLPTMAAVYGVTADAQLLVRARSPGDRAALGRQVDALLASRYPELEAQSTAQVKAQISSEVSRQFNLFNAIVAIAVVVSLLGVVNTLAMSVAERRREIGVLRALGCSRWLVRGATLHESLLITTAGAVTGVVLGAAIAWAWVRSLDALLPGIAFSFPVATAVGVAVAAVVMGTLAAVLPAQRAARLNVLEALTYE